MQRSFVLLLILLGIVFLDVSAQRRSALGTICGDPTAACRTRENFQPYELPFEFGKNYVIAESKPFYAVILKSVKLNASQSNCDKAIPESDRTQAQTLFPRNMVFVMRCWESGQNSYTNTADGVSFMAVYAGPTLKDANNMLARVRSTGDFPGAMVRRMRIQINGT
jgi:hypothetical protein